MRHIERHRTARLGWLRAAVLEANDGLISTASLVVGVAASGVPRSAILISGIAGLAAGPMAMAAGEYVSMSSQLPRAVTACTLVVLAALGALAARVGGAVVWRGAARVTFWARSPWASPQGWDGRLVPRSDTHA